MIACAVCDNAIKYKVMLQCENAEVLVCFDCGNAIQHKHLTLAYVGFLRSMCQTLESKKHE